LARLGSLKQYFLLQAGDLWVHFLDSAESELGKDPKLISREKLQSLLEISVRSSSAERDPYKDDVFCYLASFTYPKILYSYQSSYKKDLLTTMDFMNKSDAAKEATNNSKGFEYFTLDYHAEWPLNLILTESNILLYKLLFKNLFSLHYVQRELFNNWKSNQTMKNFDIPKPAKVHFLFVQRMLNFVRNVINNFCYEVIENHWRVFVDNINNVAVFDAESVAIRGHHRFPRAVHKELHAGHADAGRGVREAPADGDEGVPDRDLHDGAHEQQDQDAGGRRVVSRARRRAGDGAGGWRTRSTRCSWRSSRRSRRWRTSSRATSTSSWARSSAT
jgi:hypothetical protein